MFKSLLRFLGMYSPSEKLRIAMYRKAGIKIGNPYVFGSHVFLDVHFSDITIGDDVIIAGFDYILSHSNVLRGYKADEGGICPVVIKKGARISINVTILPGVTIGENAVIGAGAVVNKDIPDNCLAVGVPAKPIKFFKPPSC
ncbi:MAG: acyltransferase [Candidatus Bathyarchaeota archaeon]|nr:acyltransferase [Candidatus Bathyarchaeum sp.]